MEIKTEIGIKTGKSPINRTKQKWEKGIQEKQYEKENGKKILDAQIGEKELGNGKVVFHMLSDGIRFFPDSMQYDEYGQYECGRHSS